MFTVYLMFCNNVSIAETVDRDVDVKIERTVLKHMIKQFPTTIKNICVMEIDISKSSEGEAFLKFKHVDQAIDKRIVQDPTYCDDINIKSETGVVIYHENGSGIIDDILAQNANLWTEDGRVLNAFRELKRYISHGYIVSLSQTTECGTSIFGFVFRYSSSKMELVRTVKVGTVECFQKNCKFPITVVRLRAHKKVQNLPGLCYGFVAQHPSTKGDFGRGLP